MKRLLLGLSAFAAGALLAIGLASPAMGEPVLTADRTDYRAGETVILTGFGWEPGETVTVTFVEDPALHDPVVLSVIADETGGFTNAEFVIAADDLGVRFYLEAIGQTSGYRAQAYFADPGKIVVAWDPLLPGQQPNPVKPGGTATFLVKIQAQTGSAFSVNLRVLSGLPAGANATFVPNPVVFSGTVPIGTTTLTITTAAGTPLRDHSVRFRAEKTDTPTTDYYEGIVVLNVRDVNVGVRPVMALPGKTAGEAVGLSAASADMNGDGYPDLIAGAPAYSNWTGRAYVYFGGPAADDVCDLVLNSPHANAQFGQIVACVGDINRDGYDDVGVSATGSGIPGHAFIYYGGAHPDAVPDLDLTAGVSRDAFGVVFSAGDLNGDGYGDVVVTAPMAAGQSGRAYAYYGGPVPDASPDLTYAVAGSYRLGTGGATAIGDVNGDGLDDLAVGSHWMGTVHIYFGSRPPNTTPDMVLNPSGATYFGGYHMLRAGDLNGDGYADLVVGASGWNSLTGRVYVYFGGPGFDATPDLILTGDTTGDWYDSPTGVGDLNGDGHADLMTSSPYARTSGTNAGRVYVYFGGPALDGVTDLTLTGGRPLDNFGQWQEPLGDFNDDGYPEVIVGAPGNDDAGTDSGKLYVFSFMPSPGAVQGQVTAACPAPGTGIGGVSVGAYRGSPGGTLVKSTVTDGTGAYRLDPLIPGQYWVRVAPPAGFSAPVNDVPVTLTVAGTATVDFTLLDVAQPVLTLPADVVASAGPGIEPCGEVRLALETGTATATDNCGEPTIAASGAPEGGLFPVGETLILWTATDVAGNVASGTQRVMVYCPVADVLGTASRQCNGASTPASDVTVRLLHEGTAFRSTATDAAGGYRFEEVRQGTYTVVVVPPPGYGIPVDTRLVSLEQPEQTLDPFVFTCLLCDLTGRVDGTCNGVTAGLHGVIVDLYRDGGEGMDVLVATAATDAQGAFRFEDLALGEYTVGIVLPLGYTTGGASQVVTLATPDGSVEAPAFALACQPIAAEPRSMGYWKHQVNVYLTGKGTAEESLTDLLRYLDEMVVHFNQHLVNPVIVYVPNSSDNNDKLLQLQQLLTVNRGGTMLDRAKQQLLALLLNVVSGKISQTAAISDNGATVAQAITYSHDLIVDALASNDEAAKNICDLINNGQRVLAGMVPAGTRLITYGQLPAPTEPAAPVALGLGPIAPNPATPDARIGFALPTDAPAWLELVDLAGRMVHRQEVGARGAGYHSVRLAELGRLRPGIYLVRISQGRESLTRRLAVVW